MKRRHFLKLSGLSTAALFFNRSYAGTGAPRAALHFPTAVATLQGGNWVSLTGSKENWTLRDLTLRLTSTETGMTVQIQSPKTPLEKLRLSWDLTANLPSTSICLGDAWERSYGDLSWQNINATHQAPWYLLISDG
jgi:alpha-galactosidase